MRHTLQEGKLKDKFDPGDKDRIEKAVQDALDWLDKNQLAGKDELAAKHEFPGARKGGDHREDRGKGYAAPARPGQAQAGPSGRDPGPVPDPRLPPAFGHLAAHELHDERSLAPLSRPDRGNGGERGTWGQCEDREVRDERREEGLQETKKTTMGSYVKKDMSISEFWQYTQTIERKKGTKEDARQDCWEGVLIAMEREIWRTAQVGEYEREDIATCERLAMAVIRRT